MTAPRLLLFLASLFLLLGVGAGAFGAHALKSIVSPDRLAIWQTAVLYQLVHGLGILLTVVLAAHFSSSLFSWSAVLMIIGIILFCGSLYALTLTPYQWLGPLTPLGGICFIAAWAVLAIAAWRIT